MPLRDPALCEEIRKHCPAIFTAKRLRTIHDATNALKSVPAGDLQNARLDILLSELKELVELLNTDECKRRLYSLKVNWLRDSLLYIEPHNLGDGLRPILFVVLYDSDSNKRLELLAEALNRRFYKAAYSREALPESPKDVFGQELPQQDPASNPDLISLADASAFHNIPKSLLSKASRKKSGDPGFLRCVRDGRRVYFHKKDIERLERSRAALGRKQR